MAATPSVPIVGSACQYIRGGSAPPLAAILLYQHKPDEVTVIYWNETGQETVRQNINYVAAGQPQPKGDYIMPLPTGAPVAAPASSHPTKP